MNLDDESLLSAYLDGELDARRRVEVEAALHADPHLTRRLGDLTATRDLVAGLCRPAAPADLAASILARLPRPHRGSPRLLRFPPLLALGAAAGLTAGILIAGFLTRPGENVQIAQHAPAPPGGPVPIDPPRATSTTVPRIQPAPDAPPGKAGALGVEASAADRGRPPINADRAGDRPLVASARSAVRMGAIGGGTEVPATPAPALAAKAKLSRADGAASAELSASVTKRAEVARGTPPEGPAAETDRAAVAGLFHHDALCRITVTVDEVDTRTVKAVLDCVDRTPKMSQLCAKVVLSQEIAIDPSRPGKAVVYALTLSAPQRDKLAGTLTKQFGEVVIDKPEPPVVAELADIGRRGQIRCIQVQAVASLGETPPQSRNLVLAQRISEYSFYTGEAPAPGNAPVPGPDAIAGNLADRPVAGREAQVVALAPAQDAAGITPPAEVKREAAFLAKNRARQEPPSPPPTLARADPPSMRAPAADAPLGNPLPPPPPERPMTVLVWLTRRGTDPQLPH